MKIAKYTEIIEFANIEKNGILFMYQMGIISKVYRDEKIEYLDKRIFKYRTKLDGLIL